MAVHGPTLLADELTLAVLYGLVPLGIPIPVFLLGLFR